MNITTKIVLVVMSFLLLELAQAATLTRGPYLQMGHSNGMTIRWRSDSNSDSVVHYGLAPGNLNQTVTVAGSRTEHEVVLSGLSAATQYYYSVGSSAQTLAGGDSTYRFATSPNTGVSAPTRIWIIGDSGTANADAAAVYSAYLNFNGADSTELWLMLGDNAYSNGTDGEYQNAVFNMYPELLKRTPLWPTLGNHDGQSADSATESGPYYDIFTLPRNAEIGGLASGTEAYYSFDYGDIHFICLDSYDSNRSTSGAMMTWLENDIAATSQKWLIAFWHHPPYSKGSHNSDTEGAMIDMRQNALPILESYGVDLVFSGHSHAYERSYLLDGHYGNSSTFLAYHQVNAGSGREDGSGVYFKADGASHSGAVYTVAGASGKISGGALNHPAMYTSLNQLGSVVLDVNGNRLDFQHLRSDGTVTDYFTLIKGTDTTPPDLANVASSGSQTVVVTYTEAVDEATANNIANYAVDNAVVISNAVTSGNVTTLTTSSLSENITYTLTINNVTDTAGNAITANSQAMFSFINSQTFAFQNGVSPTSNYSGTEDTYIASGVPSSNWGSDLTLLADGDDGSNGELVSLLRWDVTAIPSGATILSATLEFDVFNPSAGSYEFYSSLIGWAEGSATWSALDPYNNRGNLLGSFSPSSSGQYSVTLNSAGTTLVQGWVDGTNNGLFIMTGGTVDGIDMRSSEHSTATMRPRLVVTFSSSGGSSSSSTSTSSSSSSSSSTPVTLNLQEGNGYSGAEDTYVAAGANTSNWGSSTAILADGDDGPNEELMALLKWDLTSTVPSGATVTSAAITLQVFNKSNDIYNLWGFQQAWSEATATWNNTQPMSNLGSLVGSFSPLSTGSYTIDLNAAGIALVQSWLDGSDNDGLVVQSSGTVNGIDIRSSEYSSITQRPLLSITYQ